MNIIISELYWPHIKSRRSEYHEMFIIECGLLNNNIQISFQFQFQFQFQISSVSSLMAFEDQKRSAPLIDIMAHEVHNSVE